MTTKYINTVHCIYQYWLIKIKMYNITLLHTVTELKSIITKQNIL